MHRSFKVTLPADVVARSVWQALNGLNGCTPIPGAVPIDGILPDRCCDLKITADSANAAATLTVTDANSANTTGRPLVGGDVFEISKIRNSICLKDYFLKPSANSLVYEIDVEYN